MKIGDQVIMNGNYYVPEKNRGKVFTVRSRPFMVCGTVCVLLEDYCGSYAADGLSVVVSRGKAASGRKGQKETPPATGT
ncbi:MAG: hypothetical protein HFG58_16455 [Lachnospiraceae bacterium]|jgi:hypothetical protein|nr:hypothetical protein [Lachnospiraceae bacterium]